MKKTWCSKMVTKEEILNKWKKFLKEHLGFEFNPYVDIDLKAEVCANYNGACPCLVKWRLSCPCSEAIEEIKEVNACYCMVFKAKHKYVDLEEHSEMTKKAREKLGIG